MPALSLHNPQISFGGYGKAKDQPPTAKNAEAMSEEKASKNLKIEIQKLIGDKIKTDFEELKEASSDDDDSDGDSEDSRGFKK